MIIKDLEELIEERLEAIKDGENDGDFVEDTTKLIKVFTEMQQAKEQTELNLINDEKKFDYQKKEIRVRWADAICRILGPMISVGGTIFLATVAASGKEFGVILDKSELFKGAMNLLKRS